MLSKLQKYSKKYTTEIIAGVCIFIIAVYYYYQPISVKPLYLDDTNTLVFQKNYAKV